MLQIGTVWFVNAKEHILIKISKFGVNFYFRTKTIFSFHQRWSWLVDSYQDTEYQHKTLRINKVIFQDTEY